MSTEAVTWSAASAIAQSSMTSRKDFATALPPISVKARRWQKRRRKSNWIAGRSFGGRPVFAGADGEMIEQPVVKNAHWPPFQRGRQTGEPVSVGTLCRFLEELHQPPVHGAGEMALEHECDSETAGRRIEDELAGVEIIDIRRLELGHSDRSAPGVEHLRHLAMEEDRHPAQVLRAVDAQRARADRSNSALSQQP